MTYQPEINLTHEDHANLVRLEEFRRAHPGIEIHQGHGFWQGIIPEDAGSTVITRYTLVALLDRLRAVVNGKPAVSGGDGGQ